MNKGVLLVISGFSGAGKGTIVNELLSADNEYKLSISATTREPRAGEIDGVHYHFISKEHFEEMIKNDDLIEYNEYQGNYYGTPKPFVVNNMNHGADVILEIDVNGGDNITRLFPDAVKIFVTAPSAAELRSRLVGRATDSDEKIAGRLKRAVEEIKYIGGYDYLLINRDVKESAKAVDSIIRQCKINKVDSLPDNVLDNRKENSEINCFINKFEEELISITKGE